MTGGGAGGDHHMGNPYSIKSANRSSQTNNAAGKKLTKKRQMQSRLDNGVGLDGSRKQLLETTSEELGDGTIDEQEMISLARYMRDREFRCSQNPVEISR